MNTNSSRSTAFRNMMHQRAQQFKNSTNKTVEKNEDIQAKFVQIFSAIQKAKESCKENKASNLEEIFNELVGEVAKISDEIIHMTNKSEKDIER